MVGVNNSYAKIRGKAQLKKSALYAHFLLVGATSCKLNLYSFVFISEMKNQGHNNEIHIIDILLMSIEM